MSIKSNLEKHTVNWLTRQDVDGKLHKNISIQRKEVWDVEKKSNLIVSLLLDIPIESLLFEECDSESYNVLDGKQRTLTLCAFVADEFALSAKIRLQNIDNFVISGQKFSNLPENMQQKILEYELSISILRPLESEERATVFFMRNQAVPLSKMDLSLVMLGEKAMDKFAALCNHSFMQNKIKLTAPARRKHDDLRILLQYLMLIMCPESGFSGAEIMSFCDDIKNGEAVISYEKVAGVMDFLDDTFTEKRKYLKLVHVPIVMSVAQKSMEHNLSSDDFVEKLDAFFDESPDEYLTACMSGSSKRGNVQTRVKLMEEAVLGR